MPQAARTSAWALVLAPVICFAAAPERQAITIKGSDTLVGLAHRWAKAFNRKNPSVAVQITGGGSATGLAALEAGATDLATSSRPMTAQEQVRVAKALGAPAQELAVVRDSVAFFVSPSNPVKALTLKQLRAVLMGDVTRWSDLGGADKQIIIYARENTSGTYAFLKEHLLGDEDFSPTLQQLQGTGSVVNAVSHERWAIGFGGSGFARNVQVVALRLGDEEVLPTRENVESGKYPLSRPLYVYAKAVVPEAVAAFLTFVKSDEGQQIASKAGFLPL